MDVQSPDNKRNELINDFFMPNKKDVTDNIDYYPQA